YIPLLSDAESIQTSQFIQSIIMGHVVVPRNNRHGALSPVAIGKGTRVKINANIGTSPASCDFENEIQKLKAAISAGADAVMDLSIAGNSSAFRKCIIEEFDITLGTVPIYDAMIGMDTTDMLTVSHFLRIMEKQAAEGVDFMTIHAGLLSRHLPLIEKRTLGVVSRGGAIMAQWMKHRKKESFLYAHFDEILDVAKAYDVTLSIGDGLRPGCTHDANDAAQFGELEIIGELVQRCRSANVQVMVEGPGHVPLNLIEENVRKEKELCDGAPFYVLGPLVIDYAAGYDHIAGAIGGALAGMFGADFLCYVTPAEHLRLPTIADVHEGVIASKIAAAAADLARKRPSAISRNLEMSKARKRFDWKSQQELSVDKHKFSRYLEKVGTESPGVTSDLPCTMCGEWCAMKRL
ncbi:MAG: phosphomethylpyrimidine synthase ThiC, partial [Desulfatirhabdiaceae bacterium]